MVAGVTSMDPERKWLTSTGGPTVILQTAVAEAWGGIGEDLDGELESWGDYGSACKVDDWLGVVDYGIGSTVAPGEAHRALVLGGEPLMSTYVAELRLVVRWHRANSYEHLFTVIEESLPKAHWEPPLEWEVPPGGLVMIDATCTLHDYRQEYWKDQDPAVPIDLPPGDFRVETATLASEDRRAEAIVHRFTQIKN